MKQITNKEYEKCAEYRRARCNGEILDLSGIRFICESNVWDAEKIGKHLIESLMHIEAKKVRSISKY